MMISLVPYKLRIHPNLKFGDTRQKGLVSAGDPCNAPGGKSLPERVANALLPKPKPTLHHDLAMGVA